MSTVTRIVEVVGWEALDSRGNPTVGCEVRLEGGGLGRARVPSGASRGRYEVVELRDGDERYAGGGVRRAVANVSDVLADVVRGLDARDQAGLDRALREADGTPDLARLGGNAVLAVSVATAIAAADAAGLPLHRRWSDERPRLPMPMFNIISGGAHAGGAVDVQDLLVLPVGAATFTEAVEWGWRVRHATSAIAAERGLPTALVADEGGLGLPLASNEAGFELLVAGVDRARLRPGEDVVIAVDVAAGQLADDGRYHLAVEDRSLTTDEMVAELSGWCERYPIASVEDPLHEDDRRGWVSVTRRLGDRVQIVGDDLFATDPERLEAGIADGVANAILVKPNQVGTLTDARRTLRRAAEAGYRVIVSARSGDTEDDWLADLAVGWGADQIKVGSLTRAERTAKWNRLLYLEARLGPDASFAGRAGLGPGTA